jgi:hypothetical protein
VILDKRSRREFSSKKRCLKFIAWLVNALLTEKNLIYNLIETNSREELILHFSLIAGYIQLLKADTMKLPSACYRKNIAIYGGYQFCVDYSLRGNF